MKRIIMGLIILSLVMLVGCKTEQKTKEFGEMKIYIINENRTNSYIFNERPYSNWELKHRHYKNNDNLNTIEVWYDTPNCIGCTI